MQRTRNSTVKREATSTTEEDPDKAMVVRNPIRMLKLLCANSAERPGGTDREAKLRRIKEEIRTGKYETKEKLDIAINRLIDDFFSRPQH